MKSSQESLLLDLVYDVGLVIKDSKPLQHTRNRRGHGSGALDLLDRQP